MRLSELIPQPFRNIYNCSRDLQKPEITVEERTKAIQSIAKDVFRLLLAIPMITIGTVLAPIPFAGLAFGFICMAISPSSLMLNTAALSAFLATVCLVSAVATVSFPALGAAVLFGVIAYAASENYRMFEGKWFSLEDRLITPLSNQLAEAFI